MKKTSKILLCFIVFILFFSSICLATNSLGTAPVTTSTDGVTNSNQPSTVLNSDLYLGNQEIVVENVVNGNVFAFGSSVTIKEKILGDLFVFANTLTIEETSLISGNVFALSPNIIFKGEAYDVYAISNNFELADTATIYRDLKLYSGTVHINGIIKKDAYILTNTITMPEGAKDLIGGNLHYSSPQESTIPDGAVLGNIKYTVYSQPTKTSQEIIVSYITRFITTIIYAIIIILLAAFFAPKFIEKANYNLMQRPFISAGIGILSIVLIPVVAIFFMISGFLSYVGIALAAVYGLILSITLAIFSLAIAKSIDKKIKNPSKLKFILFAILSAVVLWIIQLIPYIGSYASIFIYVMGLGVFLFSFFSKKDGSEVKKS